jgi:hypothetical protein
MSGHDHRRSSNETVLNALMAQAPPITRRLDLSDCGGFMRNLLEALRQAGVANNNLPEFLGSNVAAVCAQCGIRLSADDLLALSGSGPADDPAGATRRLALPNGPGTR